MKKQNIIITAGPTNETIDAVMKITNMSTGALGAIVADTLFSNYDEQINKIYYISTKLSLKPNYNGDKIVYLKVESAEDLLNTLEKLLTTEKIDAIVHSSAVGDYVGEYVIRAEDIVDEILSLQKDEITREKLISIFENPSFKCNNDTKISSYEKNLIVKLGLTPKVISSIKKLSPSTKLIGFKLLEGVTEDELYEVAHRLLIKNDANYIVANLLNRIGGGKHFAMILDKDGVIARCNTKQEIAYNISRLIF